MSTVMKLVSSLTYIDSDDNFPFHFHKENKYKKRFHFRFLFRIFRPTTAGRPQRMRIASRTYFPYQDICPIKPILFIFIFNIKNCVYEVKLRKMKFNFRPEDYIGDAQ